MEDELKESKNGNCPHCNSPYVAPTIRGSKGTQATADFSPMRVVWRCLDCEMEFLISDRI